MAIHRPAGSSPHGMNRGGRLTTNVGRVNAPRGGPDRTGCPPNWNGCHTSNPPSTATTKWCPSVEAAAARALSLNRGVPNGCCVSASGPGGPVGARRPGDCNPRQTSAPVRHRRQRRRRGALTAYPNRKNLLGLGPTERIAALLATGLPARGSRARLPHDRRCRPAPPIRSSGGRERKRQRVHLLRVADQMTEFGPVVRIPQPHRLVEPGGWRNNWPSSLTAVAAKIVAVCPNRRAVRATSAC